MAKFCRHSSTLRRLIFSAAIVTGFSMPVAGALAAPSTPLAPASPPSRMAVPNRDAQARSEKVIRDVFGNYASAASKDRATIAARMIEQASATRDDPAARYVLLKDAADLAAGAGDAPTAMQAVDLMAQSYMVEAGDLKVDLLRRAAFVASGLDSVAAVVDVGLNAANDAVNAGNYDLANRYMGPTEAAARNAKDLQLLVSVIARAGEIRWMQQESGRARLAEQRLATAPDDPDANLVLGRFLALVKNNWRDGLPRISRGSNPAFRAAAAADLANPREYERQVAVGDLWWNLSEKEPASPQLALRHRAALWYSRSLSDARFAGLSRARVEKRMSLVPGGVTEDPSETTTAPTTLPSSVSPRPSMAPAKTVAPEASVKPAAPAAGGKTALPANNKPAPNSKPAANPAPAYPVPPPSQPAPSSNTPSRPDPAPAPTSGGSIFSDAPKAGK